MGKCKRWLHLRRIRVHRLWNPSDIHINRIRNIYIIRSFPSRSMNGSFSHFHTLSFLHHSIETCQLRGGIATPSQLFHGKTPKPASQVRCGWQLPKQKLGCLTSLFQNKSGCVRASCMTWLIQLGVRLPRQWSTPSLGSYIYLFPLNPNLLKSSYCFELFYSFSTCFYFLSQFLSPS